MPFDNQQAWLDAIPNSAENQDWITGIDEQQIETLFDEYDAQLQAYVDQNQPDISLADTLDSYTIIPENRSRLSMGLPYRLLVKGTLFSTLPSQLRYNITVRIYNSLSDQRLDNPSLNQTISLPAINVQRLGLTYEPATESDAIALQNYRDSEIETLPAYLFKLKPVLKLENTALATGTAIGMGQQQHLTITLNDPIRGPLAQKSHLTAGNEVVIGVNGNGISSQMVENRFSSVDPNTAAENLQQTALNFWMMHDFYDDLTAQVHQVRRVRLPSVGLFVSPLTVSYFYGIARNGIYKSRVIDVQQNIQAVVAPSFEARFEYMSQIGIYGSYLENSVIEELFDYELGRGVSATQVLLEANAQQIPIYAITKENIDTVLPLLSVSQEVKTDIINGIHAGQHAIVPQREIQHGNWQGSGYIIQDSITGAGAYLLEGGLNGGALEGLSCDASKNPMAALINMVIQVMELYFNIVAMISFGSFALAAVAVIAFRVMVKTLLKAVVKKQVKKKRAKKRKKKKRTECDCDKKKKKTRKSQTGKDECEPELKLVSVEFLDDLDIYKDQVGKAPLITGPEWVNTDSDDKPDTHERICYSSGKILKIKAKFAIEDNPTDLKTVTITGNAKAKDKNYLFKDKAAVIKGDFVTTKLMAANGPLASQTTQFFNPMKIEWKLTYKKEGVPTTAHIGTTEHQIYVTFGQPSKQLDKLYLSLLHWAVSADGAKHQKTVVEKTWSHFANPTGVDDIKTWDKKRTLRYYGTGIDACHNDIAAFLKAPDESSGGCGVFANLFIETLWVNGISSKCVNVSSFSGYEGILINNWEPLIDKHADAPTNEYKWKFRFSQEASMFPPLMFNIYGNLASGIGIAGQNTVTPVEKAFDKHFIVKILAVSNLSYYDPSYGITYQDSEEFDREAVFGYFSDFAEEYEPPKWWVRRSEDRIYERNILFQPNGEGYPLCGSDPRF